MFQSNNPFSDPQKSKFGNDIPKAYNRDLYDHLQQGNTINFIQARAMGISQLDTHIAEIRKITNVYSRNVRINSLRYMEYSLQPFV
jgi:acid phosphatase class B